MTQPLIVIAAGGTGGHMFPSQALAEEMLARGWRVTLSTDARGARYADGFPTEVAREVVASATFARGGVAAKLGVPFRILGGVFKALLRFRKDRPEIVVGFGGYPTIPAMGAAILCGLPRMIHEQNGVLGRVNALLAKRVTAVAAGTWPVEVPAGVEAIHTGNPVRGAVLERAGAGYIAPGDYPMTLVAIGGSQGARVLSDVVPNAIARLPEALRGFLKVEQQARAEDVERVVNAYDAMGVRCEVAPFFEDIPRRLSEAQLVVSRSGASSVADISVIGRPSILVPFAAATGDHQTANARGLVDAGAAVLMPESTFTSEALAEQITLILTQPDGAQGMANAALAQGRPDATQALAGLVETLTKGEAS